MNTFVVVKSPEIESKFVLNLITLLFRRIAVDNDCKNEKKNGMYG